MNRTKAICSTLLLVPALALVSAQARAEFKCDAPASRLDRVACEKASESPQALRQHIQRMRAIDSLYFPDYVDDAQARAWESRAPSTRMRQVTVQTARGVHEEPGA